MQNDTTVLPVPPLEVLQAVWRQLRQPITDMEETYHFAQRIEAKGFDRATIKWLARLPHEPTEQDRSAYELSRA